jgi:hypothetical protein
MSNDSSKQMLAARMLIASSQARELVERIKKIETDSQIPKIEKFSLIKKIRNEISNLSEEIDNIQKETKLLNSYQVN